MPDPGDPAELLDVNVEQLAGPRAFVPPHRRGRVEGAQARQVEPPEDPPHRGPAERYRRRDPGAGPPGPPQGHDLRRDGSGRRPGRAMRPARAIPQAGGVVRARRPLPNRALRDAERLGHDSDGLPLLRQTSYDLGSTVGRRPGILVTVHPGLLWRQVWGLATTSLPDRVRMDNLLSLHT